MGLTIWEFMAKSGKTLDELIQEVYAIVGPFAYDRNDLHISEALKQDVLRNCNEGRYTAFGDLVVRKVETIDGYHRLAETIWPMAQPPQTDTSSKLHPPSRNQTQDN